MSSWRSSLPPHYLKQRTLSVTCNKAHMANKCIHTYYAPSKAQKSRKDRQSWVLVQNWNKNFLNSIRRESCIVCTNVVGPFVSCERHNEPQQLATAATGRGANDKQWGAHRSQQRLVAARLQHIHANNQRRECHNCQAVSTRPTTAGQKGLCKLCCALISIATS